MPLEDWASRDGLVQPNRGAIVLVRATRSLAHGRQRKEPRIVRDVRGHLGEPVRVHRHCRRVVKTGGLVTLLPARPLGPSLEVRPDRRRADVFDRTRRLRYTAQPNLDHVQRPVKHRGHVRVRHVWPVPADEVVVKVGEKLFNLRERIVRQLDHPVPQLRPSLPRHDVDTTHAHHAVQQILTILNLRLREPGSQQTSGEASAEQAHHPRLVLSVVVCHSRESHALLLCPRDDVVEPADPGHAVLSRRGPHAILRAGNTSRSALHSGSVSRREHLEEPFRLVSSVDGVLLVGYASLLVQKTEAVTVRTKRHQRTDRVRAVQLVSGPVRRSGREYSQPRYSSHRGTIRRGLLAKEVPVEVRIWGFHRDDILLRLEEPVVVESGQRTRSRRSESSCSKGGVIRPFRRGVRRARSAAVFAAARGRRRRVPEFIPFAILGIRVDHAPVDELVEVLPVDLRLTVAPKPDHVPPPRGTHQRPVGVRRGAA